MVLQLLETWFRNNKIIINAQKTKYMLFYKSHPLNITLENNIIESVETFTYLGVTLDRQMKFNQHANIVENKLSSIAGVFRRISKHIPEHLKKRVYYALFHSNLIYGMAVWGSINITKMNELQVVQNRAIKNLYEIERLERTKTIHQKYDLLPVNLLYQHMLVNAAHNIITKKIHSSTTFQLNNDNHNYGTRTSSHLHMNKVNPKSITYNSVKYYNNIPAELKQGGDSISFKIQSCLFIKQKFS